MDVCFGSGCVYAYLWMLNGIPDIDEILVESVIAYM